jgi:hypothetical protein
MIRSLGVEPQVVIWEGTTTFADQVTTLSRTGVFIALHGAGLMNEVFLPPGSVVIEIFPPHVKHVLYERICHNSGVYHFKVRNCVWFWFVSLGSTHTCARVQAHMQVSTAAWLSCHVCQWVTYFARSMVGIAYHLHAK